MPAFLPAASLSWAHTPPSQANYCCPWQLLLAAQTSTPCPAGPLLLSVLPCCSTSAVYFQNHCTQLGFTASLLRSRHWTRQGGTQVDETQPSLVGHMVMTNRSDLRAVLRLTGVYEQLAGSSQGWGWGISKHDSPKHHHTDRWVPLLE